MRQAKIILWVLILSLYTTGLTAQQLNTLYHTLDSVLANVDMYKEAAVNRIGKLESQLKECKSATRKYDLAMRLYEENKAFDNNAALRYIEQCLDIARTVKSGGDRAMMDLAQTRMAYQCSKAGMYNEAVSLLSGLDPAIMSHDTRNEYYQGTVHVYGEMAYYCRVKHLKDEYLGTCQKYGKLWMENLDPDSDEYLQMKEEALRDNGKVKEALKINDKRLTLCDEHSHQYAIVAYYRHLDYARADDAENVRRWLLKSAITDVENAVMDQGSLWILAQMLLDEGDLERAYRYINYAWDCANYFDARVRTRQVSPILTAVDKKRQQDTEHANRLLRILAVIISLMAVILLLSLIYVYRQRKRLALAHVKLSKSNTQLSEVNDNMTVLLRQVEHSNQQLQGLNHQLSDTNRVKDEYIGRFMQLCSLYVDKMEDMRKYVIKMIKGRKYQEMLDEMHSSKFKEKELEELHTNFDKAFLRLFPNFVDEFNAMVKPEEQVTLSKEDKSLPTTIRIFALIRIGIEDSSKIAYFLHYSVNTIYNYRARVKNAALGDRSDFEERIKQIGMPQ